jgi:hypothetical protein
MQREQNSRVNQHNRLITAATSCRFGDPCVRSAISPSPSKTCFVDQKITSGPATRFTTSHWTTRCHGEPQGGYSQTLMGNLKADGLVLVEFGSLSTFAGPLSGSCRSSRRAGHGLWVPAWARVFVNQAGAIRRRLRLVVSPLALRRVGLTSRRKCSRRWLCSREQADARECAARHRARSVPDRGW